MRDLDGVFAQDSDPIEVIVVDDGSTDGSARIAQSYSDIRSTGEGTRTGRSADRGIEVPQGELVAFVDSDDVVLPQKLATQVGISRSIRT